MAVNVGDIITAAQYNGLQSRISSLLGTGSGDFGYGQSVTSSQVTALTDPNIPDGDTVSATQMDNLRADMTAAYKHQTGSDPSIRNIASGDVIGADKSGTGLTYAGDGTYTFNSEDTTGGFNDYLSLMDTLETSRFTVHNSQYDEADLRTPQRTIAWNGTINATVRYSWNDADHARHFFNAGGEIHVEGNLSSGTGSKSTDWANMLANPGRVRIGYNYVTIDGSTTGVTLVSDGWYDLTVGTPVEVFTKTGNAAVYAENRYRITITKVNTSTMDVQVQLEDNDTGDLFNPDGNPNPGPVVDENVDGTITITYGARTANGTSTVNVPYPATAVTDTFE